MDAATVTLGTARRAAGDLLERNMDLVWDREYQETADSWFITVDSSRYYMTQLDRHRLKPPQFVQVPKDGSAPRVVHAVTGDVIRSLALGDPVLLPRVDDRVLYYSQPASVWREWLPQLRYFRLDVVAPHDDGRDQFVARIHCPDNEDATARLRALDVPSRLGDGELETGHPPLFARPVIEGIQASVRLQRRRPWVTWDTSQVLRVSVREAEDPFRLTEADFRNALRLEELFDRLGWQDDLDHDAVPIEVVTRDRYPELFE